MRSRKKMRSLTRLKPGKDENEYLFCKVAGYIACFLKCFSIEYVTYVR